MNPRINLPSASSFGADVACPGRQNLIKSILPTEVVIEDDPSALRGTRIHAALESGNTSELSEDEVADYERAKKHAEIAIADWEKAIGGRTAGATFKEHRLWFHEGIDAVLSGQPDLVLIRGTDALVLDYKSGWCSNLTPSEKSWQLRVLAVLIRVNYMPITNVRVGFVKPKSYDAPTDITDYDEKALELAEYQIRVALWASKQPNAPRSAGSHCRYCPAALSMKCPEAASYSLLPSVVAGVTLGAKKADVEVAVQRLTPQDWKFIWERASVIRNILASASDCLKKLTADDLKELGLAIGEGRRLDPITNVIGCYKALEHSLPPEALWSCLSFEKGKLVEAVRKSKGCTKKDAEIWVRQMIEPFVEPKRADGSLESIV